MFVVLIRLHGTAIDSAEVLVDFEHFFDRDVRRIAKVDTLNHSRWIAGLTIVSTDDIQGRT
jgi:hypothetical protein